METCHCKELCFYYKKTKLIYKNNTKYFQTYHINKCNRLIGENTKKKPCDYKNEILIEEKIIEEKKFDSCKDNNSNRCNILKKKYISKKNIYDKIELMLQKYYSNCYNYFGNLNYQLKLLGYFPHEPTKESLSELRSRLENAPTNKKYIYLNKDSYFSKSIAEHDYDYEYELDIFNKIKNRENPFEWTNDNILQDIISIKSRICKKNNKHNKIPKKHTNKKTTSNFNDIYDQNKLENCYNCYNCENDVEDNDNEENDNEENDNEDNEDNKNDDEDNEDNKNEDNKNEENEFDVENFSDEDNYEDNDYDDFSD